MPSNYNYTKKVEEPLRSYGGYYQQGNYNDETRHNLSTHEHTNSFGGSDYGLFDSKNTSQYGKPSYDVGSSLLSTGRHEPAPRSVSADKGNDFGQTKVEKPRAPMQQMNQWGGYGQRSASQNPREQMNQTHRQPKQPKADKVYFNDSERMLGNEEEDDMGRVSRISRRHNQKEISRYEGKKKAQTEESFFQKILIGLGCVTRAKYDS
eukprot:TRINITY_DN13859_c0_g1_i2.p1 TRINITY_DN13859_c0_g1~~TRINITY_DN13859_c0_g1_i2.p1  ORF type:complete len:207 (+),score=29.72 TRINITY_DN13859_c0_g1_i2:99-719(+)